MHDKQALARIAIEMAKRERRMITVKNEEVAKKIQESFGGTIVEHDNRGKAEFFVHFGLN